MKKFKLILFLLITFLNNITFAQKSVTIIFRYNPDSLKKDSFYFPLKRPFDNRSFGQYHNYPEKIVSVRHQNDFFETICHYTVKDSSCVFLGDGFGYKTFVIPDDTLIVNVNSISHPATKINGRYARPWFHNINIEGKNKFTYMLFDSLAHQGGALGWSGDVNYNNTTDLSSFCKLVDEKYKARLLFLEKYNDNHHIANVFINLARSEIYAAFINNLLRPLLKGIDLEMYPPSYRDVILKARFTDPSTYFKTSVYSSTAYSLTSSIARQNSGAKPYDNDDLISIYNLIKQSYPDTIKNHLLTTHLSNFLGNPNLIYPAFDSLLTDFKVNCKNNLYVHFLDSLYSKKKAAVIKKYTLDDAMSSKIIDINGQTAEINNLFKLKPVLIICWASWCVPCIKEMPFEKKLQREFKDKIDFIYLSFDKNKSAWENKSKALNIGLSNYLLIQQFTSNFAHFYQLSSLPYYVLYDKNGNKIEIKDLRPSNDSFKDLLKKL
ncbi:TlpA family protein disulfide reductase [Mucilaginibacter segetis]|uniref:TlpA family protein disulfide reductase n=1 Tax=Mucilaginibacter segetis TaxID=2793071 RepID=A0A934PRR4_9SPHI|nr:TlpA disulfide reductase family protein [Mucilaginibacter segetis]MBK0378899.1 TlpA family protein disulfide reductase [Mucilaginibacter segetis]